MDLNRYQKLPITKARIPSSVTINLSLPNGTQVEIGAITEFSVSISRDYTRRFELDHEIPGQSVEIIPGKLSDLSLTIRRAMLYNNIDGINDPEKKHDILKAFQELGIGTGIDIVQQNIPFDIIEKRYDPHKNATTPDLTQTIIYRDCYITNAPYSYDITGDWLILQDVTVQVSRVEESKK